MPQSKKILFLGGSAHGQFQALPAPFSPVHVVPVFSQPKLNKDGTYLNPTAAAQHKVEKYVLHKFGFGGSHSTITCYLIESALYYSQTGNTMPWDLLADALSGAAEENVIPGPGEYWPTGTNPLSNKYNEPWHYKFEPEPAKEPEVDHLMIQVGDEKIRWDLNDTEAGTLLKWLKLTRGEGKPVS